MSHANGVTNNLSPVTTKRPCTSVQGLLLHFIFTIHCLLFIPAKLEATCQIFLLNYTCKLIQVVLDKNLNILKWSLLAGSIYCLMIAIAHLFEFKIPLFYIYYNIPSYSYQDKLIAALAFGWSMFFYTGFYLVRINQVRPVKYILISGLVAIIILLLINNTSEIHRLASPDMLWAYLFETMILLCYQAWLIVLYIRSRRLTRENR